MRFPESVLRIKMTKTDTLAGPAFKPGNAIGEPTRHRTIKRLQRIPNGYGGTVTEPVLLRERGRVLKGIFLSTGPFAQFAFPRERVVSCYFLNHQHWVYWGSVVISEHKSEGGNPGRVEGLSVVSKMPEAQEEDEVEHVPIPLKNVSPAILKKESELNELIVDLTQMGCGGFLAKPWNLCAESTLREFLFERGNQWFRTVRHDPNNWTSEVWAEVYGCPPGKGEGWATRRDSFHVGKFWTDPDPKDGFHPGNCQTLESGG